MTQDKHKTRFGKGISTALYVLAGLMLIFSVVLLVILLSTANAVQSYDIYFQMMGIGELAQMILRPLQAGMINLGILVFVVLLIFSVLLAAAGWLLGRQTRLVERVEALERRLEDER
jgi:cytochrome b subunit of formate dehydrogenase